MVRKLRALLVASVLFAVVGIAGSPPAMATPVSVGTEAEYRAALSALSADNSGPHTITLTAPITITGGTDPAYTGSQDLVIDGDGFVLDGGGTRRILDGSGGAELTLLDVEIRNGFTAVIGGGGVRWVGPVRVDGAVLADNTVSGPGTKGGGALRVEGAVTVVDSVVTGNTATSSDNLAQGGAITASPGAHEITVERSVFTDNAVVAGGGGGGGGALRAIGDITVTDVVATGNSVIGTTSAAGGFFSSSGVATLTRARVHGNTVGDGSGGAQGGGVFGFSGVTAVESSFTGNVADGTTVAFGSAINANGTIDLTDVTVAANLVTGTTSADGAVMTTGTLTGRHTTIVDNEGAVWANVRTGTFSGIGFVIGRPEGGGPNCKVTTGAATYSVDDDGTCKLATGTGNLSAVADLGLGPARDNGDLVSDRSLDAQAMPTLFPLAGSPVVDLVPVGECADGTDQRGVARPFGAGCEAGAIEQTYPEHGFGDVPVWVEDAVRWLASDVNDPALITGITPTTFVPNDPITRGQVVRMLYREAGSPDVSGHPSHGFSDVPGWVEDAVRWAKGEDIATGITATLFKPNDPISRAQVTRMKYRFAGSPAVGALPAHPFTDVPAWVQDAVRWAANTTNPLPLATGITATLFKPNDPITRAQVARMDYRLAITPAAWADQGDAPNTVPFRAFDP